MVDLGFQKLVNTLESNNTSAIQANTQAISTKYFFIDLSFVHLPRAPLRPRVFAVKLTAKTPGR